MLHVKPEALPNEPCPCGSGKKYKRCCGTLDAVHARQRRRQLRRVAMGGLIAAVVVVVIAVGAMLAGLRQPRQVAPPPPKPPAARAEVPGSPQPPGPAPEGKVWSVEHGHWHDAPTAQEDALPMIPGAPPPGPAPEGKVWSEEHGHWHDAVEPPALPEEGTVVPEEDVPVEQE